MKRRDFIAGVSGAIATPSTAHPQERVRRIGVLTVFSERDTEGPSHFSAFQVVDRETAKSDGHVAQLRASNVWMQFRGSHQGR
jgi:hypothetical protein